MTSMYLCAAFCDGALWQAPPCSISHAYFCMALPQSLREGQKNDTSQAWFPTDLPLLLWT